MHYLPGGGAVNMTEYCLNATAGGICVDKEGSLSRCPPLGSLADYGCVIDSNSRGNRPFAAVTLSEVIDKAAVLVAASHRVRNIFVMTDDHEWLQSEARAADVQHPSWRVFALPPPRRQLFGQTRDYYYARSAAGTSSGALLHASLQVAGRCQALVGHFGSSVTKHLYRSMCFRHGLGRSVVFGHCPPVFDTGRGA